MRNLVRSSRKFLRACISTTASAALLMSGVVVAPVSVSAQDKVSRPRVSQAAPRQSAPRQVQRQPVQRTQQSVARSNNRPSQAASRPAPQRPAQSSTPRPSQSSNARPSQNSSGGSPRVTAARPATQSASNTRQPVKRATPASASNSSAGTPNRPPQTQPKTAVPKTGNTPLNKTGQAAPVGGQGKTGLAPSNATIKPVPNANKLALPNAGTPANKNPTPPPQAQIKGAPPAGGSSSLQGPFGKQVAGQLGKGPTPPAGSSSLQGPFGKQIAGQLGKGSQPAVKPSNMKPITANGLLPAKLPPVRPPVIAPQFRTAFVPNTFGWHPWRGRNLFPYFFVGAIVAGGSYAAYNYWSAPVPSCYVGGLARYYYPGTRVCYDFASAVEGDDFEVEGRVYRWQPTRYRTVETLIESEEASAEPSTGWVERQPVRAAAVQSNIQRAASRAQTLAALPPAKLDCSTCLSALGPTQGENNMCTVSVVNNCDHDVSVVGGLTRTSAAAGAPPLCDFTGDVGAGLEVVACSKPCDEFADAQVFLNTVVPAAGTPKPAPSCRPQQQQAQAN
jgi:hypothetical protein